MWRQVQRHHLADFLILFSPIWWDENVWTQRTLLSVLDFLHLVSPQTTESKPTPSVLRNGKNKTQTKFKCFCGHSWVNSYDELFIFLAPHWLVRLLRVNQQDVLSLTSDIYNILQTSTVFQYSKVCMEQRKTEALLCEDCATSGSVAFLYLPEKN